VSILGVEAIVEKVDMTRDGRIVAVCRRDGVKQRIDCLLYTSERFTRKHGRKPTNNEVAVLVRESRADKLAEISTERLRKQQHARLLPDERHALKHLHLSLIHI